MNSSICVLLDFSTDLVQMDPNFVFLGWWVSTGLRTNQKVKCQQGWAGPKFECDSSGAVLNPPCARGDPGVTGSGRESWWAPADCWDTKIRMLSVRSFDVSKEALSPNNYMQCPDFKMVAWFCKNPVQAKHKYISGPKSALVLTVCDFNNQKNKKALASGVIFSLHYVNAKKAKGCLTLRRILVSLHYLGPLLGPPGLFT